MRAMRMSPSLPEILADVAITIVEKESINGF